MLALFSATAAFNSPVDMSSMASRRAALLSAASLAVPLSASAVERSATFGEIRKADQSKIGVGAPGLPKLKEGLANRGAGFAGKSTGPAGGLAFGDAGPLPVKMSYGYENKECVFGCENAAVGTSGPNGFFAGGEDFGGISVGKNPSLR